MSDVYRLKLGIAYGEHASGGDWRYFESTDDLAGDLLAAHLDMLESARRGITARLARLWRGSKPEYPRVDAVFAVERHTDAGWIPVEYRLIEPAVEFVAAAIDAEKEKK